MSLSLIKLQSEAILDAIRKTQPEGQWRYVIADAEAMHLILNETKKDDILNQNVPDIFEIENKRVTQSDLEAIYILTPKPHVVDALTSEFKRPKPRNPSAHLIWTSSLPDSLRSFLGRAVQESGHVNWIQSERILPIEFSPRETHLFTFKDPKSFFPLYHPRCDDLAQREFREIAKKLVGVCVALEEFPVIRYFQSPYLNHRARQLPQMIAFAVQRELEQYQEHMRSQGLLWPPEDKSRPKGLLLIADRSLDPVAPLLHEFTYQAMAHDLLPIQDRGDKIFYTPKTPSPGEKEPKEMELSDEDKVWVRVRHKHMKDTIEQVMAELDKFVKDNPEFQNAQNANTVFAIKTMLASLPQFTETKDAYELHLTMAQECMDIFGERKLPDTADLEQSLATGLDSNNEKVRGLTEQLIRLLDSPTTATENTRLRLIMLFLLWKDGLLAPDLQKLFRHAKIGGKIQNALYNLDLIGVRIVKQLKEPNRPGYKNPPIKPPPIPEGYELSRYNPVIKQVLEDHVRGVLDPESFPYADSTNTPQPGTQTQTTTSIRTAKPTWTRQRLSTIEPRQRIIVFIAGGATYSESRACYEVSKASVRDVYLGSSHMITPNSWLEQLSMAREDRRELNLEQDIPAERRPKAPAHLFEPDVPVKPPQPAQSSQGRVQSASPANGRPGGAQVGGSQGRISPLPPSGYGHGQEKEKKKKHRFLGLK